MKYHYAWSPEMNHLIAPSIKIPFIKLNRCYDTDVMKNRSAFLFAKKNYDISFNFDGKYAAITLMAFR